MKKIYLKCLILAIAAVLVELFVFNFRTFESLTFAPVNTFTVTAAGRTDADSAGTTDNSGTDDTVVKSGQTIVFYDAGNAVITLEQIDAATYNLHIDAELLTSPSSPLTIRLSARDEGNEQYYELPEVTIDPSDPSSSYIRLNLSGKAKSIRITFKDLSSPVLRLNTIDINSVRPLDFSILRLASVYILFLGLYLFRPGSRIFKIPLSPKRPLQKIVLAALLSAQLAVASGIILGNQTYCDPPWVHHYQYHQLAVAISEGHFYLDTEPSQELKAMDNPYDRNERDAQGVDFQWDTAYYNGKYYCYFGVLPVLVYYLPYYLLTGGAFPTFAGIMINCAAIITGSCMLLYAFVKNYFRRTSIGLFILLQTMLVLGCGLLLIANPPTFYNMPVSMAVALTLWGLYFWIKSAGRGTGPIRRRFLCTGAVCMALVAACRPQMLVGSFLLFPIFHRPLKQWMRRMRTASGETDRVAAMRSVLAAAMRSALAAAVPYLVVAALLMYYNWARFGSPFDFGANYNLTTNDMTHRGFHLDRLPFGLFMYLFQPPSFSGRFPFMTATHISTGYQGTTIAETMYGGFFWFNLITAALFFWKNARKRLKARGLSGLCLLSAVLGMIVVCADVEMAGILQRYGCDFGLFLTLPAVLIALAIHEETAALQTCAAYGRTMMLRRLNTLKYRAGQPLRLFYKILAAVFWLTAAVSFFWLLAK